MHNEDFRMQANETFWIGLFTEKQLEKILPLEKLIELCRATYSNTIVKSGATALVYHCWAQTHGGLPLAKTVRREVMPRQ